MESFSTYSRQHRGHDGNASAGRRGTFKNKTWVAGDRSGSSTPFPPGHLGADGPRWERGGARGFPRGRGRGKGRSPRPDIESSQQPYEDASEQEDNADGGGTNGVEVAVEPVLETLEERERFYQEVGPFHIHTSLAQSLENTVCRRARGFLFCFLARQGTRGGAKEGHCGGEDGRPARPEAPQRGYHYGRNVHGHVSALRAVPSRAREQPVQLGSRTSRFYAPHRIYALMF